MTRWPPCAPGEGDAVGAAWGEAGAPEAPGRSACGPALAGSRLRRAGGMKSSAASRPASSRWWSAALDVLLPRACHGCGEPLAGSGDEAHVCPRCWTRLRSPPHPRCARCAAPASGRGTRCRACARWPAELAAAAAVALW
ncbi:MAG: hypothetical protein D6701_15170, partial [Gemmatimonadetes bacterium]